MKLYISAILFSLLVSAFAKPGGTYILTGREKSIFSIFQDDMKAYPNYYAGEDVNAYYQSFKTQNNLGERKLQLGEELIFPDTAMSKKIRKAEEAEAAKAAAEADAAVAGTQTKETKPAAHSSGSTGKVTLFGSDRRSSSSTRSREAERARAEAEQKNARHQAIRHYQHTLLPHWIYDYNRNVPGDIENGNIDTLIEQATEKVDETFSKALVLHRYPDQGIYILEFEKPEKVGEYFFFAIKKEGNGRTRFYSLEQGISFFGAGDESVLREWLSSSNLSDLGGRTYKDLPKFQQELEAGTAQSEDE